MPVPPVNPRASTIITPGYPPGGQNNFQNNTNNTNPFITPGGSVSSSPFHSSPVPPARLNEPPRKTPAAPGIYFIYFKRIYKHIYIYFVNLRAFLLSFFVHFINKYLLFFLFRALTQAIATKTPRQDSPFCLSHCFHWSTSPSPSLSLSSFFYLSFKLSCQQNYFFSFSFLSHPSSPSCYSPSQT